MVRFVWFFFNPVLSLILRQDVAIHGQEVKQRYSCPREKGRGDTRV